jgi:signal transduction histidine kinase
MVWDRHLPVLRQQWGEVVTRWRGPLRHAAARAALHGRPLTVRLVVLLLPPTLVAGTFGMLRLADARDEVDRLADAERYAAVSVLAVSAAVALEDERDLAARGVRAGRDKLGLAGAYAAADRAVADLTAAAGALPDDPVLRFGLDEVRGRLGGLAGLRRTAFTDAVPATEVVARYGALVLDVIDLGRTADSRMVLLAGDAAVAAPSLGVYDLLVAAGLASQRRAVGTAILARGVAARGERGRVGGLGLLVDLQTAAFRSVAGAPTLALFQAAGAEAAAADVDALAERLTGGAEVSLQRWIELTTLHLAKLRRVVRDGVDRAAAGATARREDRQADSRTSLVATAGVLLGTLVLAAAVGHGLVADLRRLRDRMRRIARWRLAPPPAAGTGPPQTGAGEIGELSRTFEDVYHEAVRVVGDQQARRTTTTGLARTLTRRTQDLVARQLELISELEQRELNPVHLNRLFELDHLATRARRYGDNLLVLTGDAPAWRWPQPAPLAEVVRAAGAAIEQYPRVEVADLPDVAIAGRAVVELVQILTELLDNGTRFSAPGSPVRVTAGLLADGWVRIEVRDLGPGLGSRSAAALNARLNRPELTGLGDEPTLGLHVVSALAARTGVAVHLVPIDRGCVATVAVPPGLIAAPAGEPVGAAHAAPLSASR